VVIKYDFLIFKKKTLNICLSRGVHIMWTGKFNNKTASYVNGIRKCIDSKLMSICDNIITTHFWLGKLQHDDVNNIIIIIQQKLCVHNILLLFFFIITKLPPDIVVCSSFQIRDGNARESERQRVRETSEKRRKIHKGSRNVCVFY